MVNQNLLAMNELNEIELEKKSYLVNSDELIFETLCETKEEESCTFPESPQKSIIEDINIVNRINSPIEIIQSQIALASAKQYKCPTCKKEISITNADFIKGIALASCSDCGRNAFAVEDLLLIEKNQL